MDAYLNGLPFPATPPPGGGFAGGGEGRDIPTTLRAQHGVGHGDSFTPLPGVLPSKDHLDYAQKLSVVSLLLIGLVMLLVVGILNPRRALGLVARGAARQAGLG